MDYYVHKDGQQWGPYDEAAMRALLAAQQVLPTDLCWNEQMPEWATIESVFAPPAPAPVAAPLPAPPAMATPAAGRSTATPAAGHATAVPAKTPAATKPEEEPAEPEAKFPAKKSSLPKIAAIAAITLAVVGAALWFFVFKEDAPEPRTRNEIFLERESLPALFLTGQSKKRITAPGNKQFFLDAASKEICWRAMACTNPKCPAPSSGGEPPLFINPNPSVFVKPDGTLGEDPARAAAAAKTRPLIACPECLKNRTVASESREAKEKYLSWVEPYMLPETAKRIKELDAELKQLLEGEPSN